VGVGVGVGVDVGVALGKGNGQVQVTVNSTRTTNPKRVRDRFFLISSMDPPLIGYLNQIFQLINPEQMLR
jgi:hypothetical protein